MRMPVPLGQAILRQLAQRQYPEAWLASQANVTLATLRAELHGQQDVRLERIERYCVLLDLEPRVQIAPALAAEMKGRLRALGKNQHWLAAQADIARSTMARALLGQLAMPVRAFARILDVLGLDREAAMTMAPADISVACAALADALRGMDTPRRADVYRQVASILATERHDPQAATLRALVS